MGWLCHGRAPGSRQIAIRMLTYLCVGADVRGGGVDICRVLYMEGRTNGWMDGWTYI